MDLLIEDLMMKVVKDGGSDLHLATGHPPTVVSMANCSRSQKKSSPRKIATG